MSVNRDDDSSSEDGVHVSSLELAMLFFQSVLLGATTAFSTKFIFASFAPMINPLLATSGGLFLGLLVSYPSIRVFARAGGYHLGFIKWFVICTVNAVFVMVVLSVLYGSKGDSKMKLAMCAVISTIVLASSSRADAKSITLVIHGGAGTILKKNMTAEREKEYRDALAQALKIGHGILAKGGTSLDAIEATIRFMEDSPLFNAGKGAVFTHDGRNELDAAIMNGRTKAAGAVAGLTIVKNPISAARAVMEKSKHVMMFGRGAELFATEAGLEIVDPSYFWTERRWKALQNELLKEQREKTDKSEFDYPTRLSEDDRKFGTVGALALDANGDLAAGTSTGGMTNKRYGRVGDAPIIGAGTYASNDACAVSATGHGEYFIRWTVAYDIASLMKYKGLSVNEAADEVMRKIAATPGDGGGVIALDAKGNVAMPFTTEGMYRGYIRADGVPHVFIYKDE